MRYGVRIFWIGFYSLFCGFAHAQAQEISSNQVEVMVDGKSYESVRQYKLEQIKSDMARVLYSIDLRGFTKEELCGLIAEVRNLQAVEHFSAEPMPSNGHNVEDLLKNSPKTQNETWDLISFQMQEMLKEHYKKHKDENPLLIDKNKVKSIIIEPNSK